MITTTRNIAGNIADHVHLVSLIFCELNAGEVLNQEQQFKPVKLIEPQIIQKVRGIGDVFRVYTDILGDECTDFGRDKTFLDVGGASC